MIYIVYCLYTELVGENRCEELKRMECILE